MKADRKKLELVMARKCMSTAELTEAGTDARPNSQQCDYRSRSKTGHDRQDRPGSGCGCN